MLNNSEWVKIYRYLLKELQSIADNSLVLDVERAASARIEESVSEDNEIIKQFSRESRENLDPIRLREPSPREAFEAAVGVLITRLHEVPVLADRVTDKFNCDAINIQWHPDTSERDQVSERGPFSAFDFKLERRELEQIQSALKRLENLLGEQ